MKQYNPIHFRILTVIVSVGLCLASIAVTIVILEIVFKRENPIEIPFHNVLYPYVEF